jgi:hypothetical protein
MVGGAGGHTSPFGGCLWLGRFGASRGIPNKDSLGHFHASRSSNLNWVGRFSASQRLQLINTRLIPNTRLFPLFLAALCDLRRTTRG